MAPAAEQSGTARAPQRSADHRGSQDRDRLLPLLTVERGLRAVVLIGVGVVLVTHAHADWTDLGRRFAEQVGLDPSRNETGRLIARWRGSGHGRPSGTG
ncbi:MAG: hypothetical protein JO296_10445 [Pseudonocardiales bacterium]|jgi:hypothetical protein|nr:hypothetical protein [Pseudonocardiales bacterium]MBV9650546.1 hypothetical protein [Pseudonocardiales bacterium]